LGIKKLRETFSARSDVRCNEDFPRSIGFAFNDPEYRIVSDFHLFAGNFRNIGKRREFFVNA
jgi:hypothetical protein